MLHRRHFIAGAAIAVPFLALGRARAATPRIRRDVMSMQDSDPFFAKYAEAIKKMHELPPSDGRNWRNQSLIHMNFCKHGTDEFFHWHRHYISNFEAICAELCGDPDFALPYWNWSAKNGRLPDPFYDLDHLNVTSWKDPSNAYSDNWGSNVSTTGSRNLSKGEGLQDDPRLGGEFKKSRIDQHQRQPNFSIYRGLIESSPHGGGHVVSGGRNGHMGDGMSPLDPIFWLHHCNVDRLWAEWQKAGNTTPALSGNYANNFVDAKGAPVTTATSASAMDIGPFGYTYDVLNVAALSAMTSRLALQSFETQTVLRPAAVTTTPRKFGEAATQKTASMRIETRFSVQTVNLLSNLFQSRTYWATDFIGVKRLAAESGRIVARLSQVVPPETPTPMVVNVFANCPYLSAETDSNDLHYAGSFSFFGSHAGHAGHGGQGSEVYVDMTDALSSLASDGRIANETVNVQLMPLPIDPKSKATFSVGTVELLAT